MHVVAERSVNNLLPIYDLFERCETFVGPPLGVVSMEQFMASIRKSVGQMKNFVSQLGGSCVGVRVICEAAL